MMLSHRSELSRRTEGGYSVIDERVEDGPEISCNFMLEAMTNELVACIEWHVYLLPDGSVA
jgi:hypothetical protein